MEKFDSPEGRKGADTMFRVFTDYGANLPSELVRGHGITVLPLRYELDGVAFADYDQATDTFDGEAYYAKMRAGAEVKTSMTNVGEFAEAFRPVLEAGEDVLYVGMSSGISGTNHAACLAAAGLREEFSGRKIAVVDTRCASLGEGIPVLRAAELREEGHSIEQTEKAVLEMCDHMCQYFTVADLRYLQKGGRISALTAKVGGVLNIKPILQGNEEGRIVMNSKVRGERRAYEALAKIYDELCSDRTARIGVAHADNPAGAEELIRRLRELGFTGEALTVCYEPVTGSHVGPGTVAFFFPGIHR